MNRKAHRLAALALVVCGCGVWSEPVQIPNGQWQLSLTKSKYSSGTLSIQAPQANLTLVLTQEGTEDHAGCVLATARVEVAVAIASGNGDGSVNYVVQKAGAGCSADETQLRRSLLSTLRIERVSGSGTGFEHPEGTWRVTGTRPDDVAEVSVVGGMVNGTFANRTSYSFSGSLMRLLLAATDSRGATLDATRK
jgi:hypothetical protein